MIRCLALAICFKLAKCNMEGFIVGGSHALITRYPHSAFMNANCVTSDKKTLKWICGASIVNQQVLLTAAHCLASCTSSSSIRINVGSENKQRGIINSVSSFLVHEDYSAKSSYADIGLIKMSRRLNFGSKISRVALMRKPPQGEIASVAGWGLTDEDLTVTSPYLKYINQTVKNRRDCLKRLGEVPRGCICASSNKLSDYASAGDSGSALMIRGYIQIGIVSHKVPSVSRQIIVYTETAYFYNWIKDNMDRLFCS
ncbi:trypsin delta [Manduca sexta]|uniref:Peptidase S1 domain-containing protein n=1 Tax=Manduca sexta TaxID=7130 RepID=A0A921Z2Z3_MANSE|nr:trypsin delta [Manduca sexta]KAG6450449.1 hypothetical protein O3G_MSEX006588 [Manduca sexta]